MWVSIEDNAAYVDSIWQGEGWYRIAYSDCLKWDRSWYEYRADLLDDYESAYKLASEFHLPYIDYFGCGENPDYDC